MFPTAQAPTQNPNQLETDERSPQTPQPIETHAAVKQLPEDIRNALIQLVEMGEREADLARRGHYKRMLEAEEFWKGNQYPIWSEKNFSYRTPWDYALEKNRLEDQPVYQYIINVYQAYGLTVIAALSQRVPKVRFFPHSTKSETDIATARAASDVAELIEKNNNIKMLARREAYLLWTQGGFGTYTRFVRDKKKGLEEMPIIESSQVPITPDAYMCQGCGAEIDSQSVEMMNTVDDAGFESSMGQCPTCGYEIGDADFIPGEVAEVPVISGYEQVPEGFEKMSVYGFLNIKMMPYAQSFEDSGYLHLVEDVHEAAIKASYPAYLEETEDESDGFTAASQSSSDAYERIGRLKLFDASMPYSGSRAVPATQYVTYKRCWLRNWYLAGHPDKAIAKKLMAMFPDGVYVALAGDKFLDARGEDVDDYWTICSAMPGWGIYTEPIGGSTIPLQKQINDGGNIIAEHLDFGTAPPIFYDAEFISGEGLRGQKMRPGTFFPITRTRGGSQRHIKELMHQPDIKIDANIYGYGRTLVELTQVVNGALPSLFGGSMKGNETLGAYQQSRDQAMGKMILFWAAVKQHHADTMRLGVNCFAKNRTQDAEKIIIGKSNDFVAKYIRLEDLKGNIIAEPEADEDFPATWAEIRSNLQEMIKTAPELATVILNEPANSPVLKKFLASPAIILPAEAAREKQFREIDELLMAAPIPTIDPMAVDPVTGAPIIDPMTGMPPIKWMPTIMPDVHVDNHVVEIKAIQEWAADPDGGILAKKDNPEGFSNVLAHLISHKEAMAEMAAFDASLAMKYGLAPAGGGEGGEGESDKKPPEKKAA